MNVSEMIQSVNLRTDEDFQAEQIVSFLNDAISKINTECSANFPNVTVNQDEEYVLPEKWQRQLLVTYASARVKQNDSSQFEYVDLYREFEGSLLQFRSSYVIPDAYKDAETEGAFQDTLDTNPWSWEGGW